VLDVKPQLLPLCHPPPVQKSTYHEEMIQPINDGVDIQDRLPVFTQNIEAYIAFQINIGMVNLKYLSRLYVTNSQIDSPHPHIYKFRRLFP